MWIGVLGCFGRETIFGPLRLVLVIMRLTMRDQEQGEGELPCASNRDESSFKHLSLMHMHIIQTTIFIEISQFNFLTTFNMLLHSTFIPRMGTRRKHNGICPMKSLESLVCKSLGGKHKQVDNSNIMQRLSESDSKIYINFEFCEGKIINISKTHLSTKPSNLC